MEITVPVERAMGVPDSLENAFPDSKENAFSGSKENAFSGSREFALVHPVVLLPPAARELTRSDSLPPRTAR